MDRGSLICSSGIARPYSGRLRRIRVGRRQIRIRSISSRVTLSLRRSYSRVVWDDWWAAIWPAFWTSLPLGEWVVMAVARKLWLLVVCGRAGGRSAPLDDRQRPLSNHAPTGDRPADGRVVGVVRLIPAHAGSLRDHPRTCGAICSRLSVSPDFLALVDAPTSTLLIILPDCRPQRLS